MSDETTTPQAAEEQIPKRSGRKTAWIGGGLAIVLVVAGAIAVPQIAHGQRVSEYHELIAQRDEALGDLAETEVALEAATALAAAQQGEVQTLAQRMSDLGQTPEPILAAAHAQELVSASTAMIEVIGEIPASEEGATPEPNPLVVAVDELRAEDQRRRVAAEEAGEALPEPVAPASYLPLDVRSAVGVMGTPPVAENAATVADDEVTTELIEETEAHLASTEDENNQLTALISDEEARMAELTGVVGASALPALRAAAEHASTQAVTIVEQTVKAPDAAGAAMTAANHAQEVAVTEDAGQILDGLLAYVAAAQAAQTEHAAVVQREQEAAAAAAAAAAAQAAQAAQRGTSARGGESNSKRPRLCNRFRPSPGGGGTLVLVSC